MLGALPVHFGRDIIEECRQSASKSRTAAEWLSFYFQSVKFTPTGLEVDFPERPAWWVKIDGGALEPRRQARLNFPEKRSSWGNLHCFRSRSHPWTGGILSSLSSYPGMDCQS